MQRLPVRHGGEPNNRHTRLLDATPGKTAP